MGKHRPSRIGLHCVRFESSFPQRNLVGRIFPLFEYGGLRLRVDDVVVLFSSVILWLVGLIFHRCRRSGSFVEVLA